MALFAISYLPILEKIARCRLNSWSVEAPYLRFDSNIATARV